MPKSSGSQRHRGDEDFFKFPHTSHIAWLGAGAPRNDKLLSPAEIQSLLAGSVVVEEKLDGANLGFSRSPEGELRAQNRGDYLIAPHLGQFRALPDWMARHGPRLGDALGDTLIAFGEWCAVRHSLAYSALPDWWLLFDVYDREAGRFWSTRRRDAFAAGAGVATVPCLAAGHHTLASLKAGIASWKSHFRDGPLEGVVVRREDGDWLTERAKLVREDFTQSIESHWRERRLEVNQIDWTLR